MASAGRTPSEERASGPRPGVEARGPSASNREGAGRILPKPKKNRHVTRSQELRERAVVAMYRHRGQPSFCALRAVANDLEITIPVLVATLRAAFDDGMFSVDVHLPHEKADAARLEQEVKVRCGGLRQVLVVPAPDYRDEHLSTEERRALHTHVVRAMARRLAPLLDAFVAAAAKRAEAAHRPGHELVPARIAVAWGRTMRGVADHLRHNPRPLRTRAVEFVAAIGRTGASNAERVEAEDIAEDFGEAYGAPSAMIPCIAFARREEAAIVRQPQQVKDMLKRVRGAVAVITSMGPLPADGSEIVVTNDSAMNPELVESARRSPGCGEFCYSVFDGHGRVVPTAYTTVGLGCDDFRQMVRDGREVILVCGGDPRRFAPLKIALTAGFASWLICDIWTARYLAGEL